MATAETEDELEVSITLVGLACNEQHPTQWEDREGDISTNFVVVTTEVTIEVATVRDVVVIVVTTVVVTIIAKSEFEGGIITLIWVDTAQEYPAEAKVLLFGHVEGWTTGKAEELL